MSDSASPVSASFGNVGAPSRGRSGMRGGRGRGRGGSNVAGGRGGGRGGSFSRGSDDRGRGRGGRGRGRGHLMPQARRSHRHKPRSGKRGAQGTTEDNRFYADGTPVDPETAPPAAQKRKKEQQPSSKFALLYSVLAEPGAIAEYVRQYHSTRKFQDAKEVATFLQAISNRTEEVYIDLMQNYKAEVALVLEKLYALCSVGKASMTPHAHEFVIRCEQQGVRKAEWASTGMTPLEGVEPSLFTPRELLKKLAALNSFGRLQRQIEMCSSIEDAARCAGKMQTLLSAAAADADGEETAVASSGPVSYADQCRLISKMISKARRIAASAFAEDKTPSSAVAVALEDDESDKGEGEEERGNIAPQGEQPSESAISPSTGGGAAAVGADSSKPTEGGSSGAEKQRSKNGRGAAATTLPPRGPLTQDEIDLFKAAVGQCVDTLIAVLATRPADTTQQPIGKYTSFAAWCASHALIEPDDSARIKALEVQADTDLEAQATQLETVMKVKALAAGDEEGLKAVVEELWAAGNSKHMQPYSADVLSSIGVAASSTSPDGKPISDALQQDIAEKLFQTQVELKDQKVVLPRRALRLVNNVRNKLKQVQLAKQLAIDEEEKGDAEVEEEREEETVELMEQETE